MYIMASPTQHSRSSPGGQAMMGIGNRCKTKIVVFWFVILCTRRLTRGCEPVWKKSECNGIWIIHDGVPRELNPVGELKKDIVILSSVVVTLDANGSPGFASLSVSDTRQIAFAWWFCAKAKQTYTD